MLAPHCYLTKSTGKKPHLVSQPWINGLAQSTVINVMKIPYFFHHKEVNSCVKLLLSCYHGGYLWLDRRITVDPTLIHLITRLSIQGPDPQQFYLGKASDRSLAQRIKEAYGEVEKRKARLQGSLYTGWSSVPFFPTHSWKAHKEETPHIGHRVHGGPRRKICEGHADKLGKIPHQ